MILVTIIGFMILTIALGKRNKAMGLPQYALIALIALAQVCLVFYQVFIMNPPALPLVP